jgi:HK97 gp10 family phage protein
MPAYGIEIREDTVTPRLTEFTERMRAKIADQLGNLGEELVSFSRDIVPVRTGFLRDSIFSDIVENELSLTFGATASYAGYVEFGTRRMAAEPYLRPALDWSQDRIVNAILMGVTDAWNL